MVGLVQELTHGVQLGVVASHQTVQVEPAQLDREEQLEQGGEEEGGQGDADQGSGGDGVVGAAVLAGSGHDAQGDGDDQLQDEADAAHDDGQADAVLELGDDGDVPLPAVAEVAGQGIHQPGDIAHGHALIQTVLGVELGKQFVIWFGALQLGKLHGHGLHVRCRQTAHQHINDEGDAEQDQDGEQDTFDDVISHWGYPSLPWRCEGALWIFSVIPAGEAATTAEGQPQMCRGSPSGFPYFLAVSSARIWSSLFPGDGLPPPGQWDDHIHTAV